MIFLFSLTYPVRLNRIFLAKSASGYPTIIIFNFNFVIKYVYTAQETGFSIRFCLTGHIFYGSIIKYTPRGVLFGSSTRRYGAVMKFKILFNLSSIKSFFRYLVLPGKDISIFIFLN